MLKLRIFFVIAIYGSLNVVAEPQTLKSLAQAHNRYFGFAVDPTVLTSEPEYAKIADREFNSFTPENAMKWTLIEQVIGHLTYEQADVIVKHAQANGQKVRGHTLVWHEQIPKWVTDAHLNATGLEALMKSHITTEVERYKGKIYAWDVINEMFEWNNGTLRNESSLYMHTLGRKYIAEAFKYAHAADPAAKLYYNDYGTEAINSKSNGVYELVKELKAQNVPIHGVGFQSHFILGEIPADFQKNLERFSALGVDVAITELDIRIHKPVDAVKLEQQAKEYAQVVKVCLAVRRCVGITIWGFTDKHSWIPYFMPDYDAGLLFDRQYKEKLAYKAVLHALAVA